MPRTDASVTPLAGKLKKWSGFQELTPNTRIPHLFSSFSYIYSVLRVPTPQFFAFSINNTFILLVFVSGSDVARYVRKCYVIQIKKQVNRFFGIQPRLLVFDAEIIQPVYLIPTTIAGIMSSKTNIMKKQLLTQPMCCCSRGHSENFLFCFVTFIHSIGLRLRFGVPGLEPGKFLRSKRRGAATTPPQPRKTTISLRLLAVKSSLDLLQLCPKLLHLLHHPINLFQSHRTRLLSHRD